MPTRVLFSCLAGFALAIPLAAQQRFDSAAAAAQAVIDATEKHDTTRLSTIFGPEGNAILTSGNPAQDKAEQSEFSRLARIKHQTLTDSRNPNRVILTIGDDDWPFPVPLIRSNGKWTFDASESRTEMQARRIGAHELDAIEICAGYVAAQRKYASEEHDKDGLIHYAAHLMSTPGHQDGLYSDSATEPLVPRGFAEAESTGAKAAAKPYHGYYFRVLDAQGANATGGPHTYLAKNKLIGGFGLVAWPADYGVTGIQTFIVNQDGVIYEKDIAPPPGGKPVPITRYDPDSSWTPVD